MNAPANFAEDLLRSHEAEDLPFWKEVYSQTFPTMVAMVNHRKDGFHQRAGVDRSIVLESSKQILIDEKVRYKNKRTGKVYDDIALEYLSNSRSKALGWVCKPLLADYIAYAIVPLGKCFLLPVIQLQMAWLQHGEMWKHTYPCIEAANSGYDTYSVCVPVSVLFPAIGSALRAEFAPFEEAS